VFFARLREAIRAIACAHARGAGKIHAPLRRVNERQHSMNNALPIAKRQAPDIPVHGCGIGHAVGVMQRMAGAAAFGGRAAT
jgi:hypothetical protein